MIRDHRRPFHAGTIQTSAGQCLDMMVQGGATVAQLRGYINSAAGFAAAGPSKRLLYRYRKAPKRCERVHSVEPG